MTKDSAEEFDIVRGWEKDEPLKSELFHGVEIKTGKFVLPRFLKRKGRVSEDDAKEEKIFYLYSEMTGLKSETGLLGNGYEYYLFFPEK